MIENISHCISVWSLNTDQKKEEEKNREKGEFFYIKKHENKNPTTTKNGRKKTHKNPHQTGKKIYFFLLLHGFGVATTFRR